VTIAARLLGLSCRYVAYLCERGYFKTAHKPGFGRNAHWKINRFEIIKRKYNPNQNREY